MTIIVELTKKEQLRRLADRCVVYAILFLIGSLPLYPATVWWRVFLTAVLTGICYGIAQTITNHFDRWGWQRFFSWTDWKNILKELLPGDHKLEEVMNKNPPDWLARGGAIAGIVLSIVGLVLAYRSYRWQERVYQESLEERILVRTMAWLTIKLDRLDRNDKNVAPTEPQGTLGVEVVNIGMRPLYLKSVSAQIGNSLVTFYERDPLKLSPTLVKLEPGEPANYTATLNFEEHHLLDSKAREDVWIDVETSKKSFTQKARIDRVTVSSDLSPLELGSLVPSKKKKK